MYNLLPTQEYEKRLKKWPKKHRRELLAMLSNLDTIQSSLNLGARAANLQFGFLHHEPKGVKAVDQKGAGSGVKECRLYFYTDETTRIIHLLTIGDKSTQAEDISNCTCYVESLQNDD